MSVQDYIKKKWIIYVQMYLLYIELDHEHTQIE